MQTIHTKNEAVIEPIIKNLLELLNLDIPIIDIKNIIVLIERNDIEIKYKRII
ncbi:MAG: hypothetical protein GTO02_03325 [Candidatus Dadabacteria bacterium]|nr:hypothetical protein [Candidatus Dadabacteria bacterium]NIQ13460.1 hypothetical protein [Candidatus Dadabacteria bacterium]